MRILLVDDHAPTREEMASLIGEEAGWEVVGQAATGEEALDLAPRVAPEVVIMDIALPGMNGIEATRSILTLCPTAKVLALSNHAGRVLVQAILDAGGRGYVRKDRAFEELIPAIRAVAAGQQYIGGRATSRGAGHSPPAS